MACELVPIFANNVAEIWESVLPFVYRASARNRGCMNTEDYRKACETRDMQLWVAVDSGEIIAVAITEIVNHRRKRVCRIEIGTGRDRQKWQHFRQKLEVWAKAEGCQAMRIEARPGWENIFSDYQKTHVILEKEL